MRIFYTFRFRKSYRNFLSQIRQKFDKQVKYLFQNPLHPSLRIKKYDKRRGIWQGRVDRNVRFYFLIEKDIYILLDIKYHP